MYGSSEQFLRVCAIEGLSREQASKLLAFALRHKINISDDPFMTLTLVLGLIKNATALNLKSSEALAKDAADRTGNDLKLMVEDVVRQGHRKLKLRWATATGLVGVLCLAVTLSLGASLTLHQQAHITEFWSTLASSSDATGWEQLIKSNKALPSERACNPQSRNYGVDGGRAYCQFRMFLSPNTEETNWFNSALLGPSLKLGNYTPLSLLALGVVLGISMLLAPLAFLKWRTKR
jgi:hypothetical protein